MSRAFVNEDNAAAQADQPVERQVSAQPNYVTPRGLPSCRPASPNCRRYMVSTWPKTINQTNNASPTLNATCAISTSVYKARRSLCRRQQITCGSDIG